MKKFIVEITTEMDSIYPMQLHSILFHPFGNKGLKIKSIKEVNTKTEMTFGK